MKRRIPWTFLCTLMLVALLVKLMTPVLCEPVREGVSE